jgi:ATP-dependent DNA helicase RecG
MGDTDEQDVRFLDNAKITGPIPDMVEQAVEFVRKNSRSKTIIGDDGRRRDRPEYPIKAVREAVLNALLHRDYSVYTENSPVSIEMYRDRMVIRNKGDLYGAGSLSQLGKDRLEARNPAMADMLEDLGLTENRYSGIPTIYREFANAGLPQPEFSVRRGDFIVTFRNDFFADGEEIDKSDLPGAVLQFCKKPRSRRELVEFTGKSAFHTMSVIVKPLIESGKLAYTIPEKPRSKNQKFVTCG